MTPLYTLLQPINFLEMCHASLDPPQEITLVNTPDILHHTPKKIAKIRLAAL